MAASGLNATSKKLRGDFTYSHATTTPGRIHSIAKAGFAAIELPMAAREWRSGVRRILSDGALSRSQLRNDAGRDFMLFGGQESVVGELDGSRQ